jgi:ATP phosphoribosyltransferase regulatory subunit
MMRTWALPEHIEDVLPHDAAKLERLRRMALDLFASHGYELVMPPLLEYVDSLLTGTGPDMDLATFRLVDQLSGRMMGIRADTTPQVARIDAHVLNRRGVSRLCYAGSVVHTLPLGLGKSRQPFQVGAELYGHAGLGADIEIQQLALDMLTQAGIPAAQLDIGHPTIFRELIKMLALPNEIVEQVFRATTAKDVPALNAMPFLTGTAGTALRTLPTLYGKADVLDHAAKILPITPEINASLEQLRTIAQHFSAQGIAVSIDLGELGGFNYESGIVFSVFANGASDTVARGGRYDEIGKAFGSARPATGFSCDLKALLPLVAEDAANGATKGATKNATKGKIFAPSPEHAGAKVEIARLRAVGEIVVASLAANDYEDRTALAELGCDRELVLSRDGRWLVIALSAKT